MFLLFLKCLIMGFVIAAPVGPIALLCIQRSLRGGFKTGLLTGLGAATADTIYGFLAAFGLTALSSFLMEYQTWLHLLGGLFLMLFGIRLMMRHQHYSLTKSSEDDSPWHAYGTSVFLTLMNPLTLFSFMAICAGLGLGSQHRDYVHALILVLGIFLGSALWWLFLSTIVTRVLHRHIQEKSMHLIDKISGGMLVVFGIAALLF